MKKLWNWARQRRKAGDSAAEAETRPITLAELEAAVRAVDPSARLVPPRLLRRVIRIHASLPGFGFRVPHSKSYVIPREPLLEIAARDELGFGPDEALPPTVILLERPGTEELAETSGREMLLSCWRLLVHARVHVEYERIHLAPRDDRHHAERDEYDMRIEQLGPVVFDEIRQVLLHERFLLPPYDDHATYVEFVAVYLGIRNFAPGLMASFFPALDSLEEVDRIIAQDIDAEELLPATRLPGAPELAELRAAEPFSPSACGGSAPAASGGAKRFGAGTRRRLEVKYRHWSARADRAAAAGNMAGAAIRRARAESWVPRQRAAEAATALREDIHRLIARLQAALATENEDPRPWREALLALAHQTPRGIWTVEARLLYDLQKVCVDHERGVYTVDVVEWLLSLCKRPLKRPLPNQREVLMSKHLRSAARRLAAACIADRQRQQLSEVLSRATHCAEARLREHFRPRIGHVLADVGLMPQNLPERVAAKKIVEELLDRIVDHGFVTIGDLRDSLARNNLKQPDVADTRDFLRGDPLLRANGRLAMVLDGVYQPAEVYLRAIQRFSLLAFGTRAGRFVTRYVAIPFGGAFMILAFLNHTVEWITGIDLGWVPWRLVPPHGLSPAVVRWIVSSYFPTPVVGLFLLGLMCSARFRAAAWKITRAASRAVRFVLVDSVRGVLRLPWVQRIIHSRLASMAMQFVVKPLLPTLVLWKIFPPDANAAHAAGSIAIIFLGLNLLINSRLGRIAEEVVVDWLVEGWHRFGIRFLSGVFWFIVDVFRYFLQLIERLLYTVDEWLRFKSGQSRLMLVAKAGLGIVWFFVSYVVRFGVNLLLEPQINPLKHFPVVSVSHKLLLPFIPAFAQVLELRMDKGVAVTTATLIIASIPGIFGFLVWELRGNWRLFAANRPKGLGPVQIGDHGETMPRLLKPGFHSGTVPKRFAKLRRAERKALAGGDPKAVRKHRDVLHHVESALRRYVERELIELVADSPAWQAAAPSVGEIRLATNRFEIAIHLPGADGPCRLTFELAAGWMLSGISAGWLGHSAAVPQAQRVLRDALVGLYKTAGAELVRQQIEAAFAPPAPPYQVTAQGLMVWPDKTGGSRVLYDLRGGRQIVPQVLEGFPQRRLPTVERSQLVFGDRQVPWEQWVAMWGEDRRRDAIAKMPPEGRQTDWNAF